MNNGHPLPGGIPLGQPQQVVIHTTLLLRVAAVDVFDDGLTQRGCEHHLRIIDIPKGTEYLIPLSTQQVDAIRKAIA